MERERQIILRSEEKPRRREKEEELAWLCRCFGFEDGDLGQRFLLEILKAEQKEKGMRSLALSSKMHVTRGGAVYHLNRLMESGLVVRKGREYELRAPNLEETLEEIEEDLLRMMKRMRGIAKELDEELGLK